MKSAVYATLGLLIVLQLALIDPIVCAASLAIFAAVIGAELRYRQRRPTVRTQERPDEAAQRGMDSAFEASLRGIAAS